MSSTVPSKSPKQITSSGLSRLRIMLKRTTPAGGFTRSSWRRNASRNCSKVPGFSVRTVRAHSMLAPPVGVRPSVPCVVLPRHRLLLQPHGFEGPAAIQVGMDPDQPAVAKGERPPCREVERGPAGPAASVDAHVGDDMLVRVDQLLGLVVQLGELGEELPVVGLHGFQTPIDACLGERGIFVPLDVRVVVLTKLVQAAPLERLGYSADDLQVLPRHRYSVIPAASRASALVAYSRPLAIFPSRSVQTT